MFRNLTGVGLIVAALSFAETPGTAKAQAIGGAAPLDAPPISYRMNGYYTAPGFFGMSFGSPSYGMTRTYTAFSSSYGAGYGYGYAPNGLLPGRYGVGLWRPGFSSPGYLYGASYYSYRTFPVPYQAAASPPVGAYAPNLGPRAYYGW